jgi:hypothetical protein
LLFTIFWISGGFEQHYKVTESKTSFLVIQNVIDNSEKDKLLIFEGQRFVNSTKFEAALKTILDKRGDDKKLATISSAFTEKGVPARLTTFIFSLVIAVLATLAIPPSGSNHPIRP